MANENIYPTFRNPLGRPLKYTPDQLAEKFAEFVQWCKDNPIVVKTRTTYANGNWAETCEEKARLVSIGAFHVFLGCDEVWWTQLSNGKRGAEFSKVKANIKNFCENYQKEMASAGIFKENIISRLLGLADKQKVESRTETRVVVETAEQAEKIKNIGNLEQ